MGSYRSIENFRLCSRIYTSIFKKTIRKYCREADLLKNQLIAYFRLHALQMVSLFYRTHVLQQNPNYDAGQGTVGMQDRPSQ